MTSSYEKCGEVGCSYCDPEKDVMSAELQQEANEAFYKWEADTERTWLNDYDRIVWCQGYLFAKYGIM